MKSGSDWYKNSIIYQLYPRSFADSNGDGVGDLKGIINHLKYLDELGIDGIWLSPIYKSPMLDFGYDISDYYDIDPIFGKMDDFDTLVSEAHKLNIRIIMDLVANHTSNKNDWFLESKSSKNNPKRNWYVWKDPKPDGSPPNNWKSIFGGPAWTLDLKTGQYYLHTFFKEQPDLNWGDVEVRSEIQNLMRFWFEKGVDGFRVDAIQFVSKDPSYSDKDFKADGEVNRSSPLPKGGFGPAFQSYMEVMTSVAHEYPGRFITFESDPFHGTNPDHYLSWYKKIDKSVAAPFYYSMHTVVDNWSAKSFETYVNALENGLPEDAMPVYFYGNHDLPRLASSIGDENMRLAAMALIMLPGIRVLYYGDEIGMKNAIIPMNESLDTGRAATKDGGSRDVSRSPMQWSKEEFSGFSTHKPWLPISSNYPIQNVEVLSKDKNSILSLYRKLIDINKLTPALASGQFETVNSLHPDIFTFKRVKGKQAILIMLNYSNVQVALESDWKQGKLLISTAPNTLMASGKLNEIVLRPKEGLVIELVTDK